MLVIYLLALVYCVSGEDNATNASGDLAPPYVESRIAFAHARLYLQERIPHEERDITNPVARSHFAYGILAEVTRVLVREFVLQQPESYDPLELLYETVPEAWENYNVVSNEINGLLDEALNKISVITAKIDTVCREIEDAESCNVYVHEQIMLSDYNVKQRARLLLSLAMPALKLREMEEELNTVARKYTVVPYLMQHLDSQGYKDFIADLAQVAILLREDISQ